jgi:thiol-disulfide isomerase/thioredoxin
MGSSALLLLAALAAGPPVSSAPAAAPPSAGSPESLGDFLKPGDTVSAFEANGIDGVTRRIEYPKKTVTILIFFSSGCPHCHHMIPLWNDRFRRRPANVAMIGIMVDKEPPGFFEQMPILFPVMRMPSRNLQTDYKVARVPLMLRIAPGGVVEDVGVGLLDPIRLGQIVRP